MIARRRAVTFSGFDLIHLNNPMESLTSKGVTSLINLTNFRPNVPEALKISC